jgi:CRP-like cAMP-binding protein
MRDASLYNVTCDDIRTSLWYELKRRNIRIPFPVRSLEVRKPNEPAYFANAKVRAAEIVAGKALNCLTSEEAEALVTRGMIVLFGPGEALVARGENGDSMFVILDGEVRVSGKSDAGTQVVLAKLGPGEYFGEVSLLTGEPRNATVHAETDTLVLEIRKKDISPLIEANPALAGRLGELLERRQTERVAALHGKAGNSESKSLSPQSRSLTERIRAFFSNSAD